MVSSSTLYSSSAAPSSTLYSSKFSTSTRLSASSISTATRIDSYTFACASTPTAFNIVAYQSGKPAQYLSQVYVPGGEVEAVYGYDELPLVTDITKASVFGIQSTHLTVNTTIQNVNTAVFAAVRAGSLGNSILQFYPLNHIAPDMFNYTASINGQCEIGLSIGAGTAGVTDIVTECTGILAVLSARGQVSRGSTCATVKLFAIPIIAASPSAVATSSVALPTSTSSCALPDYFTILVNETGSAPQYLYDPNSIDDDELSFTTDSTQSLVFSLTSSGQLEFTVTDIWGAPVLLVSEQDIQNAGNEAVFFTTAQRFQALGYEPVVANLNSDCSISLTLPYNAAHILQVCDGSIFLMLSVPAGSSCSDVELIMQPYNMTDASMTAAAASSTTFLGKRKFLFTSK